LGTRFLLFVIIILLLVVEIIHKGGFIKIGARGYGLLSLILAYMLVILFPMDNCNGLYVVGIFYPL